MTITLLVKLGAVVSFTPIFVFPGIAVGALGNWCGQTYIKAQIAVKREMSNTRSPVLSHFGATVAGLGMMIYCVTDLAGFMIPSSIHQGI